MQIPSNDASIQRPSQVSPAVASATTQAPARETTAPERPRDRAELSVSHAEDPATRLARFGETVSQRLTNLQGETRGVDLSESQANLAKHLDRIQAGIADGSLSGEDLTRGVRNALALVTQDVRTALGLEPAAETDGLDAAPVATEDAVRPGAPAAGPASAQSPLERLASFEESVNARIGAIAQDADQDTISRLREAQQTFAQHLDRVRSGLGEDSLSSADLTNGMQMSLQYLKGGLQNAMAPANSALASAEMPGRAPVASVGTGGDPTVDRIAAFQAQVEERLASLGNGSGKEAGLSESFSGILDRLSNAYEGGSIDSTQLTSMFQRALSGLRSDLAGFEVRADPGLMLYDAKGHADARA